MDCWGNNQGGEELKWEEPGPGAYRPLADLRAPGAISAASSVHVIK
jgi:hypothetical protein